MNKPKRMKPVTAWALVSDGQAVKSGDGCPMIYATKKHADADCCDSEWRIVRVEIREVKK